MLFSVLQNDIHCITESEKGGGGRGPLNPPLLYIWRNRVPSGEATRLAYNVLVVCICTCNQYNWVRLWPYCFQNVASNVHIDVCLCIVSLKVCRASWKFWFITPSLSASAFLGHFWAPLFNFLNYFVWLRVTYEGSVPEMRIWSILLIGSD